MLIQGFTITPNTISVVVDGKARLIDSSREGFTELPGLLYAARSAQKNGGSLAPTDRVALEKYLDLRTFIVRQTHGAVEICDDRVMFQGMPIFGVLVERLIEQQKAGYDTEPLALFLANLMQNPSDNAKDELYLWLESSNLPITDDGHFLAWKAVRHDYKSHHDGATDNSIGKSLEMPRDMVDPDRDRTCSSGFHFCSYSYLPKYWSDSSKVMIVKINPADVVAIPSDYNNAKGRACKYTVIAEVPQEEVKDFFRTPVVAAEVGYVEHFEPMKWHAKEEDEDEDDYDQYENDDDGELEAEKPWDKDYGYVDTDVLPPIPSTVDDVKEKFGAVPPYVIIEDPVADYPKKGELRKLLQRFSQRRIAQDTGIPRTTLQGIIARYWPDKDKRPEKK